MCDNSNRYLDRRIKELDSYRRGSCMYIIMDLSECTGRFAATLRTNIAKHFKYVIANKDKKELKPKPMKRYLSHDQKFDVDRICNGNIMPCIKQKQKFDKPYFYCPKNIRALAYECAIYDFITIPSTYFRCGSSLESYAEPKKLSLVFVLVLFSQFVIYLSY